MLSVSDPRLRKGGWGEGCFTGAPIPYLPCPVGSFSFKCWPGLLGCELPLTWKPAQPVEWAPMVTSYRSPALPSLGKGEAGQSLVSQERGCVQQGGLG